MKSCKVMLVGIVVSIMASLAYGYDWSQHAAGSTVSLPAGDTEVTDGDYASVAALASVVLSDKTKLSGSIISVNTNYVTCAVSDKKAAYKDKVKVLDASGKEIGSSELYIHSVLPVIAYAGKVKTVSVKLNQVVEKGDKLLTLTGTKYSGEFSNLMYKRSVLEDQMKELFELYQTGIIYADHDGEVAGINEGDDEEEEEDEETTKSEKLSSATKKLGKLTVRTDDANANPPDGSDASSFINYVFVMGGFETKDGKTTINLNSNVTSTADMQAFTIDDYTVAPKNVSSEQYKNTLLKQYSPDVPIYSYDSAKKEWTTFSIDK